MGLAFDDVGLGQKVKIDLVSGKPHQINSALDWKSLPTGRVVIKKQRYYSIMEAIGVDFGVEVPGLHNLDGRLPGKTGQWISVKFLESAEDLEWD